MRKIIAAIAGVAIVVYVAAPYVIGVIAQRQFPRIVQATHIDFMRWKAGRFQRGYRHSTANSTLRIPVSGQAPLVIDLQHNITQGLGPDLSIAVVTTTPIIQGKASARLQQLFGGKAPLTIRTVIYADGRYTSTVVAPAVAYQALPGNPAIHVAFGGLRGTFNNGQPSRSTRFRLAAPSFEIQNDTTHTRITVDGLMLRGNARTLRHFHWLQVGHGTYSLAKIVVSTPSGGRAELDGIRFAAASQRKNDGLGISEDIHVARLSAPHAIKATNLTFKWAASHLDESSAESFAAHMASISRLHPKPAQATALYRQALSGTAMGLLAHSPELQISRLGCDLPTGRVRLTADAKFDGAGFQNLDKPEIIKRLSAHASLKAPTSTVRTLLMTALRPKAAAYVKARKLDVTQAQLTALTARMADQVLANLVGRNLLRKEQGEYISSLDMRHGALTVNGQALALPSPPDAR